MPLPAEFVRFHEKLHSTLVPEQEKNFEEFYGDTLSSLRVFRFIDFQEEENSATVSVFSKSNISGVWH